MMSSARSRHNTFAALELDRASDLREDQHWLAEHSRSAQARFVLLDADGRALLSADRRHLLGVDCETCLGIAAAPANFLGRAGVTDHFAIALDAESAARAVAQTSGAFVDLRSAGASLPAFDAGLFAYARGLAHWQRQNRFCSACGAALAFEAGGHRARCTNPQCGIAHFPRTDPAVIMIVSDGARCLLGRGPQWPERRYSTLAGFVEPGETLEDAVRREVFEEAGVRVGECDYHSSQPWPFPASIMLGFTAHAEDATITLGSELAEAHWFGAEELVDGIRSGTLGISSPLSVSYKLIEHWLRETAGVELAEVVASSANVKG
ncbi:MAG: NAD(+) diphosphatase [Xanthomonadales bacterium PRO7]|nr:NAD(+) diphosphatase [Xanthomonadales bacterium PRO7]